MRVRNKLFGLALTALLAVAWVSVSFAVEHPWDVDNRPGSSAPSSGSTVAPGTNPRPGTDTATAPRGASLVAPSGTTTPTASRQSYTSNWFQSMQWWVVQTIARFSGGLGDVE